MKQDLHEQLKRSTLEAHRNLDQHLLLHGLLKRDLSLAHYARCLTAFHAIHSRLEPMILNFSAKNKIPFDYQIRRKLPLIEADLKAIKVLAKAAPFDFPALTSKGQLIGLLYTLEGSTLGGQFIARSIRQSLGPACPLQFFDGYGSETRQRWQEFWVFAEAACDDADGAVATAAQLFATIGQYFSYLESQSKSMPVFS